MISPHTPSGTKVVFTWNPSAKEAQALMAEPYRSCYIHVSSSTPSLVIGQVYTVEAVVECHYVERGLAVKIVESRSLWSLECFTPVELPKVLTDLLKVAEGPVDA